MAGVFVAQDYFPICAFDCHPSVVAAVTTSSILEANLSMS